MRLSEFARTYWRAGDILVTSNSRRITIANIALVFGAIYDKVRADQLFQESLDTIQVCIVHNSAYSKDTEDYVIEAFGASWARWCILSIATSMISRLQL